MMTTQTMSVTEFNDAGLVTQSMAGNHEALSPNKPDAANSAMTLQFQVESHWRRVADLGDQDGPSEIRCGRWATWLRLLAARPSPRRPVLRVDDAFEAADWKARGILPNY
jgi:hypothetical protein